MKECFFKGRPVEDLIEEMPTGEIMIRAIYELFLTGGRKKSCVFGK